MRVYRHMLVSVAALIAFVVIYAAHAKDPDNGDQTQRDEHYQALGDLKVANVLLQLHWKALETDRSFKPVVEDLCDSFAPDAFAWGSIRPTVNHPKTDQSPSNDFERALLKRWEIAKRPDDHSIQTTPKGISYYKPIYLNQQSCVVCHRAYNGNEELKQGELQGVIRVGLAINSKPPKVPGSQISKDR